MNAQSLATMSELAKHTPKTPTHIFNLTVAFGTFLLSCSLSPPICLRNAPARQPGVKGITLLKLETVKTKTQVQLSFKTSQGFGQWSGTPEYIIPT